MVSITLAIAQAVITVGSKGDYDSIQQAVSHAAAHDTIVVEAGLYQEHVVIDRPLVVLGSLGAVIDGGGNGRVLQVLAPATIRGFTIQGSGNDLSREDAGIWVNEADDVVVEENTLEDVLFGVYIKQSRRPKVSKNRIMGKDLASGRRGDGIRLWYSSNGLITNNDVRRVRDVVIWFSDSTTVEWNTVVDSRYGLHYMYSDFNRFTDNRFERNEVGAFLMYSHHVVFERNTFAYALGSYGKGLGFKDTEEVHARSNLIVKNAIGIFLDNSPHSLNVRNRFHNNVIAFNEVGVSLLPSVQNNQFISNTFLGNVQIATVTGSGSGGANLFRGNFWSDYAGLDENQDNVGDTPYRHARVADDFLNENEPLQMFRLSAAAFTLDALGKLMPVLKPTPLLVDSAPLLEPGRLDWAEPNETRNPPFGIAFGLMAFAVVSIGLIFRRA